jgi:hypothetical protein
MDSLSKAFFGTLVLVAGLAMSSEAKAVVPPVPCTASNAGQAYVTYNPNWIVTWECVPPSGWLVVTRCTPEGFCE